MITTGKAIFSLSKIGSVKSTLRPHQRRVRQKMRGQDGLLVAHDMGSGKTLSAIGAAEDERQENPNARVRAVVPASLRENFRKEIEKHTDGGLTGGNPDIVSHTKATIDGPEEEQSDLTIVDEAHKARSTGSKFKDVLKKSPSKKQMLMTGTPIYNHPHELGALINVAAGENKLPETKGRFESEFVKKEKDYPDGLSGLWYRATGGTPEVKKKLKNKDKLRSTFQDYVDYHKPDQDNENFPDVVEKTVDVPMSENQLDTYRYMLDDMSWNMKRKMRKELSPNKQEASKMMRFLSGPRQVANSVHSFQEEMDALEAGRDSNKIQKILESVKDGGDKKQVIYSNFVENGIEPMKAVLEDEGIDYAEYTGSTPQKKREEDVKAFNRGDKNVMLVSSAGGEGLDLNGVREMHVMEPHWNEQKINQVKARAKRYKSHSHLTEDEQNLTVKRYQTKVPQKSVSNALRGLLGKEKEMTGSAENYIRQIAEEKENLNKRVIDMLDEQTTKEGSAARSPFLGAHTGFLIL